MVVAFIYNEVDKNGNLKGAFYDSREFHNSELRYVDNSNKKIFESSNEQQKKLYSIIRNFINGSKAYTYSGNEDLNHSLLVTADDVSQQVKLLLLEE